MTQRKAPLTALIGRRNGMYFVKKQRAPLSTDTGEKIGCVWVDMAGKNAYTLVSNANGTGEWKAMSSGLYFQEAVLSKAVAEAGAVKTEGNRYVSPAVGATWAEDTIYEWIHGAWVGITAVEGMVVYIDDVNEFDLFDGTDWNNLLSPSTTLAGLTDTTVAGLADADILVYDTGTSKWRNKALSGDVTITDEGVATASASILSDGVILQDAGANDATLAFTTQTVGAPTLTVPDFSSVSDTFAFVTLAQTLVSKTIDAASNTISNINLEEIEVGTIPAVDGNNVTVVDGMIIARVTNNATNFNIFSANAPYAFIVTDAWSINTSADGGTWKLNNGAAGAGTDITDVITVAASDKDVDRATTIDDAAYAIALNGSLSVVFDGGGALDCLIFIKIARLA